MLWERSQSLREKFYGIGSVKDRAYAYGMPTLQGKDVKRIQQRKNQKSKLLAIYTLKQEYGGLEKLMQR